MTDWELWACANQMRVTHGDDAAVEAAMRVDALCEADDPQGAAVWMIILRHIETLSEPRSPDVALH